MSASNILGPDDIDWDHYEEQTDAQANVHPADSWEDDVIQMYENGDDLTGATLPWGKTHGLFRFRPGEVTIWGGESGAGKSMLTGMIAAHLSTQNERSLIASMEMKPRRSLFRVVRQAAHGTQPPREFIHQWFAWAKQYLWYYAQTGNLTPKRVYALIRYGREAHGINHIFIDSLLRVIPSEDDYNAQSAFINELTAMAKDYEVHVHLIAHLKKNREKGVPGKGDVRGAAALTDQCDNAFLLWANRDKKEAQQEGNDEVDESDPDVVLRLIKHREGEFEGRINLFLHQKSLQFLGHHNAELFNIGPV